MTKLSYGIFFLCCGSGALLAQQADSKVSSEPAKPAVIVDPGPLNAPVPAPPTATKSASTPGKADEAKPKKPKKGKDSDKGTAPPAAAGPDQTQFVIGPEDALYVRVWGVPEVTGTVDVRPDGMISLQLAGEIQAAGLTPSQLRDEIAKRLTSTIKQPEVNIQVIGVRSKKYYITGEVNHAGSFPLTSRITLLEALTNAGGFRDFANTKKIYVLRGTTKYMFNFKDVSHGKHMEQNIWVQNGDQIFVP